VVAKSPLHFEKRSQPIRQAELELVQQGFLLGLGFGNPTPADLASVGGGRRARFIPPIK